MEVFRSIAEGHRYWKDVEGADVEWNGEDGERRIRGAARNVVTVTRLFFCFFFGLDCIPGYSCQTCSPQVGKRLAVAIFSAKPQIFSIPLRSIPLLVDQFFELCWRDVHALSITLLI